MERELKRVREEGEKNSQNWITQRKQSEDALKEQQEKVRELKEKNR